MTRTLATLLTTTAVLSSLASFALHPGPQIQLPPGGRTALTSADGPFFTKIDCQPGAQSTQTATSTTYETIALDRFTCIGDSLETYECVDGAWSLTNVLCTTGMVTIAPEPALD